MRNDDPNLSAYWDLIQHRQPARRPQRSAETVLEGLLHQYERAQQPPEPDVEPDKIDRVEALRFMMTEQLIPAFEEMKQKYLAKGMRMRLDVEAFLRGGRELDLEFELGPWRSRLHGTVTSEAIAFHESRYRENIPGEFTSGPALRMRHLNVDTFRAFICERLTLLVRTALRHK